MGIAERREREKQQRQEDIVDAAEKVFFSKGIQQATMDDVANEVELSKGTLYLYFKSKEELYLAITVRGLQILAKMFEEVIHSVSTGLKKTFAIGNAFYRFSKKHPDYFNALTYYELKETNAETDSDIIKECSCAGQNVLTLLIQAIMEGIEDESIKPDIDPRRVAIMLWGMTSGMIQLISMKGEHLQNDHGFDMENIIEDSFSMMRCALENE